MPLIPGDWIKENPESMYEIRNHPGKVTDSAKSTREEIAAWSPEVAVLYGIGRTEMKEMKMRRERDRAIREARRARIALLLTLLIVLAALVNGTAHNLRRQEQEHQEAIIATAGDDGEALSWMQRGQ